MESSEPRFWPCSNPTQPRPTPSQVTPARPGPARPGPGPAPSRQDSQHPPCVVHCGCPDPAMAFVVLQVLNILTTCM